MSKTKKSAIITVWQIRIFLFILSGKVFLAASNPITLWSLALALLSTLLLSLAFLAMDLNRPLRAFFARIQRVGDKRIFAVFSNLLFDMLLNATSLLLAGIPAPSLYRYVIKLMLFLWFNRAALLKILRSL